MSQNRIVQESLKNYRQECLALFDRLGEQEKRHVAGLLALLIGHGGVAWVADAVGLQCESVTRGKNEVQNGLEGRPADRQRLPGGGRKPLEKKVPKSKKPFVVFARNFVCFVVKFTTEDAEIYAPH